MTQHHHPEHPDSKNILLLKGRIQNLFAMINASPDVAMLIDAEGTVLAANKALAHRFGVSTASLLGRDIYRLLPPEIAASRRQQAQRALTSGQPISFQDQRDGRFFDHYLHPIQNRNGQVDRLAVFARDITGPRKMEHLLRARLRLSEAATSLSMDELLAAVLDEAESPHRQQYRIFPFCRTRPADHFSAGLVTQHPGPGLPICRARSDTIPSRGRGLGRLPPCPPADYPQ
jgi:PAS domain S-box-containing protein